MKGCENGFKCGTFKEERGREWAAETDMESKRTSIPSVTLTLWQCCLSDGSRQKNMGQHWSEGLIILRDNLYDFLWERRRTRRAAKASLRPWFGHSDIDLTVKTGAGELWCHDSMLSLLLSLKEDGSEGWAGVCGGADGRKEWRTVSERVM